VRASELAYIKWPSHEGLAALLSIPARTGVDRTNADGGEAMQEHVIDSEQPIETIVVPTGVNWEFIWVVGASGADRPTPHQGEFMDTPTVEFFSIYPGAPLPTRAADDMMGMMPARAAQLCLPARSGAGIGFLAFPPADFTLRWDGRRTELAWSAGSEVSAWEPLEGGLEIQLPDESIFVDSLSGEQRGQLATVTTTGQAPGFANAHPRAQSDV
jgi:hypothetical protein